MIVDVTALFAVFSVQSDTDPYEIYTSFENWFNDNGGFGGRPVEFFYEEVDIAEDYNQAGQRVCERFTTDNKMDVIFDGANFQNAVMLECFEQADMAVFAASRWTHDQWVESHPNHFGLDGVRLDRYAGAYIDLAVAAGLLQPGDKLGVLYEDCAWGRRVYENVSVPAAARHGIEIVNATVKCVENLVADLGTVTNQSRSAALRFQAELVSHVMVLSAAEGFIVGQFSRGAEDQNYRPNYLITTNQFPYNNSNPDTQVGFHPNQKEKAAGFGWIPLVDTGDSAPANEAQQRARARCRDVDPDMGGATQFEEGSQDRVGAEALWWNLCDPIMAMRATVEAAALNFSFGALRQAWTSALTPLESSFNVSGGYQVEARGHDAIGQVRPFTFNPTTGRFSYNGGAIAIP